MKIKNTAKLLPLLCLLCCLLAGSFSKVYAGDLDKTYTLNMTMHDAITSVNGQWYQAWADAVSEATDGHVKIKIFDNSMICAGPDVVDYIISRSADIGWVFTGFYAEQFPLAQVASIPMSGIENNIQATKALWDLYEEYDALQQETSAFKVLFLYCNPANFISTTSKEIGSMDDLNGLKLRCPTGAIFDYVSVIGASPIQMSSNEIYDNLSKNVIDGAVFEWSGIGTWSLSDSLHYYMDLPMFCGTFMTVVNWDSWNELPAEYQEAIELLSMREGSVLVASAFNQDAEESREHAVQNGGVITEVSDDFAAELEEASEGLTEKWAEDHSTNSFDAMEYYNQFETYLAEESEK